MSLVLNSPSQRLERREAAARRGRAAARALDLAVALPLATLLVPLWLALGVLAVLRVGGWRRRQRVGHRGRLFRQSSFVLRRPGWQRRWRRL